MKKWAARIVVWVYMAVIYLNIGYVIAQNIYIGEPQTWFQKFLLVNRVFDPPHQQDIYGFVATNILWPFMLLVALGGWIYVGLAHLLVFMWYFVCQGGLAKFLGLV